MFCYQPEKTLGRALIPGYLNSATEPMTRELWRQLLNSPRTEWLVRKHREVKASLTDPKWANDADFLDFDRRMRRSKSKPAKAYQALDSDEKRVALWCDDMKKHLPFVIFVATYPERETKGGKAKRWRSQKFAELTGLVVLDVDHIEDVEHVWTYQIQNRNLAELGILMVYVTPSGHGLKIVFKARTDWGNLIDNQLRLAKMLGLEADSSCKDAARGAFLTTTNDILYINEEELFTYENLEYADRFNGQYRSGNSQPTISSPDGAALPLPSRGGAGGGVCNSTADDDTDPTPDPSPTREGKGCTDGRMEGKGCTDGQPDFRPPLTPPDSGGELRYNGQTATLEELLKAYYGEKQPGPDEKGGSGLSRHTESLKWAYDLLVMTGRNRKRTEQLLRQIPWVQDIISERCEDVTQTVGDADERVREREKKFGADVKISKAMQEAFKKLAPPEQTVPASTSTGSEAELPLKSWGEQIEALKDVYPCLKEALIGLPTAGYPAGMFTAAAFFGTLMTRTWYYFYHHPEEERRLNYCVFVIGDPASGKSFANRLYKQIAAPIKAADKVGYDAINHYKEETRTKGSNKEKPKKPVVIIRDHPARTANGVFITDMNNAVETIEGKQMHLHMLTYDSELDNATSMGKGGQWIDKSTMELKAFHNEEDGQAYANLDSVSGLFKVYWNFVYTGTPLSLQRKVTERNFGSGLATRLAVIPLPPSGFKMMELKRRSTVDYAADETLKTWAYRLDGVSGELPIWPLVEVAWKWTNERMEIAEFNQDKADEMLLKRVAYYGIGIATPFIMMRHWDEWQQSKTLTIDDVDFQLCRLVMDIQYRCQHRFFGEYARNYFDNLDRDNSMIRSRHSKYDECYKRLPQTFGIADVEQAYDVNNEAAKKIAQRLASSGAVTRTKQGVYHKLKSSLI